MKQYNPKRIAIIGLPGSGKSTFAIKLGKLLNISVHHLDRHVFDGKKKREKTEFLSLKESILKEDSWIIEGCSLSTVEMRFARADTVIYFNFPRMLCIYRICKRYFGFDHNDKFTGCLDGINWPLIKYIWNFNRNNKQNIEELSRRYSAVQFFVFSCSHDVDEYMKELKNR